MTTMPTIIWLLMIGALLFGSGVSIYQAHVVKKQAKMISELYERLKAEWKNY